MTSCNKRLMQLALEQRLAPDSLISRLPYDVLLYVVTPYVVQPGVFAPIAHTNQPLSTRRVSSYAMPEFSVADNQRMEHFHGGAMCGSILALLYSCIGHESIATWKVGSADARWTIVPVGKDNLLHYYLNVSGFTSVLSVSDSARLAVISTRNYLPKQKIRLDFDVQTGKCTRESKWHRAFDSRHYRPIAAFADGSVYAEKYRYSPWTAIYSGVELMCITAEQGDGEPSEYTIDADQFELPRIFTTAYKIDKLSDWGNKPGASSTIYITRNQKYLIYIIATETSLFNPNACVLLFVIDLCSRKRVGPAHVLVESISLEPPGIAEDSAGNLVIAAANMFIFCHPSRGFGQTIKYLARFGRGTISPTCLADGTVVSLWSNSLVPVQHLSTTQHTFNIQLKTVGHPAIEPLPKQYDISRFDKPVVSFLLRLVLIIVGLATQFWNAIKDEIARGQRHLSAS